MRRYALCIGNNNYKVLSKLSGAIEDAKAIAEQLESLGFDVDSEFDINSQDMARIIGTLEEKMKEYDAILFYYAGHGFEIDGINLLAPVDINTNDSKHVIIHTAYKVSDLMDLLNRSDENKRPKTKVIILDACRTQLNVRGSNSYFAPILAPQGSIIAFSTSPGQTAGERDGHGIYTYYLLQHMDAPRISIERVFKRVRTSMVNETSGRQIPWEHTSLVGEFYLNSATIYDGTRYSQEALADSNYVFAKDSILKTIIEGFKSHNYYQQADSLKDFNNIKSELIDACRIDDLFILGRNIYQSACGNCWDCQKYLEEFSTKKNVSNMAKLHILNGMAFEIYYDSKGILRKVFKDKCFEIVMELLEREEFYGSQSFIASRLEEEVGVFYIPGQSDKVEICVRTAVADDEQTEKAKNEIGSVDEVLIVEDILYAGESIYFKSFGEGKAEVRNHSRAYYKTQFENYLQKKLFVANGYLKVQYLNYEVDNKTALLLPSDGFEVSPSEYDF